MYAILQSHVFTTAVTAVISLYIARFFLEGYRARCRARKLPGPPHSWLWGHLKIMGEAMEGLPRRVHPHVAPLGIKQKYELGNYFYLDLWPFAESIIPIMDPQVSQQLTVEYHTLKATALGFFLDRLAGKGNMVCLESNEWKKWRTIFNPGFSTQHLMSLVPGIVEDGKIYVENLMKHAKDKTVLRLEEATTRLTIDIIGKVALDLNFDMQRGENDCVEALREQVHLLPNDNMNPFFVWYPWNIYKRWRNDRIMNSYIGKVLDDRFAAKELSTSKKQRKRTILDLALDSYLAGEANEEASSNGGKPPKVDAAFKQGTITQIRTFIFAGHDTTSSTICYALYMLHKHPACLRELRREHDRVLGNVSQTADALKRDPFLLNQLEYTTCVIKETLRLFPAASAPRKGEPKALIRDPKTGEIYPTEGYMIWMLHYGTHRNPDVWGPTADVFDPWRFLPENASTIPDGAFRAFENGPRNCIGQNLAMLEARVILALVCRRLDVSLALDALGELNKDGSFYARNEDFRKGRQDLKGEEMYQILVGAAKPREGMPVRVHEVDWKETVE